MTVGKQKMHGGLHALLGSEHVRRTQQEGRLVFAAVDVVVLAAGGFVPT